MSRVIYFFRRIIFANKISCLILIILVINNKIYFITLLHNIYFYYFLFLVLFNFILFLVKDYILYINITIYILQLYFIYDLPTNDTILPREIRITRKYLAKILKTKFKFNEFIWCLLKQYLCMFGIIIIPGKFLNTYMVFRSTFLSYV